MFSVFLYKGVCDVARDLALLALLRCYPSRLDYRHRRRVCGHILRRARPSQLAADLPSGRSLPDGAGVCRRRQKYLLTERLRPQYRTLE